MWETTLRGFLLQAKSDLRELQTSETALDNLVASLIAKIPDWKQAGKTIICDLDQTLFNSPAGHALKSPLKIFEYLKLRPTNSSLGKAVASMKKAFLKEHSTVTVRPQILRFIQACEEAGVPVPEKIRKK